MSVRARNCLFAVLLLLSFTASACYDQARYKGRVESINGTELCLGPNSSDPAGTCGTVPPEAESPSVGACMSLTADQDGPEGARTWNADDLQPVADSECSSS
jgi:hypothetical protein